MNEIKLGKYSVSRLLSLFLIGCLGLWAYQPFVLAQTKTTSYKAELLVSKGKEIDAEQVEISLEDDGIKILWIKKKPIESKLIPFSAIQRIDYAYSERPRYTAGTLAFLAIGIGSLPIFFTKTKKNWLTINAEKHSAILQLQDKNYRMLLLSLRAKGINISDTGDMDERDETRKDTKESGEKAKKPESR